MIRIKKRVAVVSLEIAKKMNFYRKKAIKKELREETLALSYLCFQNLLNVFFHRHNILQVLCQKYN